MALASEFLSNGISFGFWAQPRLGERIKKQRKKNKTAGRKSYGCVCRMTILCSYKPRGQSPSFSHPFFPNRLVSIRASVRAADRCHSECEWIEYTGVCVCVCVWVGIRRWGISVRMVLGKQDGGAPRRAWCTWTVVATTSSRATWSTASSPRVFHKLFTFNNYYILHFRQEFFLLFNSQSFNFSTNRIDHRNPKKSIEKSIKLATHYLRVCVRAFSYVLEIRAFFSFLRFVYTLRHAI